MFLEIREVGTVELKKAGVYLMPNAAIPAVK